jgi:Na+-driven multidrug efflux pump
MPIGLILMVVLSILVARHAKEQGRQRFLWVILLWIVTIAGGLLGCGVAWIAISPAETIMTEQEAISQLRLPAAIGMILGAIGVVVAVNRKPRSEAMEDSDGPESKEESV